MTEDFVPVATVSYPVPLYAGGAGGAKAVLSSDGDTLYVLGAAPAAGISAYSVGSNELVATYVDGTGFSGLKCLDEGGVVATSATTSQITYFNRQLEKLGATSPGILVSALL